MWLVTRAWIWTWTWHRLDLTSARQWLWLESDRVHKRIFHDFHLIAIDLNTQQGLRRQEAPNWELRGHDDDEPPSETLRQCSLRLRVNIGKVDRLYGWVPQQDVLTQRSGGFTSLGLSQWVLEGDQRIGYGSRNKKGSNLWLGVKDVARYEVGQWCWFKHESMWGSKLAKP